MDAIRDPPLCTVTVCLVPFFHPFFSHFFSFIPSSGLAQFFASGPFLSMHPRGVPPASTFLPPAAPSPTVDPPGGLLRVLHTLAKCWAGWVAGSSGRGWAWARANPWLGPLLADTDCGRAGGCRRLLAQGETPYRAVGPPPAPDVRQCLHLRAAERNGHHLLRQHRPHHPRHGAQALLSGRLRPLANHAAGSSGDYVLGGVPYQMHDHRP